MVLLLGQKNVIEIKGFFKLEKYSMFLKIHLKTVVL